MVVHPKNDHLLIVYSTFNFSSFCWTQKKCTQVSLMISSFKSLLFEIRTVVSCWQNDWNYCWTGCSQTWLESHLWWCVHVWPYWSSTAFHWSSLFSLSSEGIMKSTHTYIHTHARAHSKNSSPIHTYRVAHPHARFYNTRWKKKRGERRLVCTEACARLLLLWFFSQTNAITYNQCIRLFASKEQVMLIKLFI